jgi:hypothetical protein
MKNAGVSPGTLGVNGAVEANKAAQLTKKRSTRPNASQWLPLFPIV